jgi:hypothetical protein
MEAQFTSDLGALATSDPEAFNCLAVDTARPGAGDNAVGQALAAWEERERRRIEFRSSLMNARTSATPVEEREMMQQSAHRRTAETREPRRTRMMAELANAH